MINLKFLILIIFMGSYQNLAGAQTCTEILRVNDTNIAIVLARTPMGDTLHSQLRNQIFQGHLDYTTDRINADKALQARKDEILSNLHVHFMDKVDTLIEQVRQTDEILAEEGESKFYLRFLNATQEDAKKLVNNHNSLFKKAIQDEGSDLPSFVERVENIPEGYTVTDYDVRPMEIMTLIGSILTPLEREIILITYFEKNSADYLLPYGLVRRSYIPSVRARALSKLKEALAEETPRPDLHSLDGLESLHSPLRVQRAASKYLTQKEKRLLDQMRLVLDNAASLFYLAQQYNTSPLHLRNVHKQIIAKLKQQIVLNGIPPLDNTAVETQTFSEGETSMERLIRILEQ